MISNKSKPVKILVVDDDQVARQLLVEVLEEEGYHVDSLGSGKEALQGISSQFYDLIITDLRMPELDGVKVLKEAKRMSPKTLVIMITAFGSLNTALEAIKAGAFDYLSKPFKEEEIKIVLNRALSQKRLEKDNQQYREELTRVLGLDPIVGRSRSMLEIYKTIAWVANSKSTVLIQGESGTGKEVIARSIHFNGPRSKQPFLVVNCAALPEYLLESELFGFVKGAFTGAVFNKKGLFEEAARGTIFLDEIGDMGLPLQAKLLRVIEAREVRKVGGTDNFTIDVRIIAATNQPLEQKVKQGLFREDLLYRLRVVPIHLPPLRERPDDIPLLTEYFLKKYSLDANRDAMRCSAQAMNLLCRYSWPGNVRELEHAIERAAVLNPHSVILPEDLSGIMKETSPDGNKEEKGPLLSLDEVQRNHLMKVLKETRGNKSEAARILGVDRRTLYRMAKRYQIQLSEEDEPLSD